MSRSIRGQVTQGESRASVRFKPVWPARSEECARANSLATMGGGGAREKVTTPETDEAPPAAKSSAAKGADKRAGSGSGSISGCENGA